MIKIALFYYTVTFNFFFFNTRSLLTSYAYVTIESIDWILLSSLALNTILLTSSVNTLYSSVLNHCSDFNTNLRLFTST